MRIDTHGISEKPWKIRFIGNWLTNILIAYVPGALAQLQSVMQVEYHFLSKLHHINKLHYINRTKRRQQLTKYIVT